MDFLVRGDNQELRRVEVKDEWGDGYAVFDCEKEQVIESFIKC